jgi:hypothetical protein
MKATSKEQYVNEWTNHVRQMINVYLDAEIPMKIWERDFADMKRIIKKAATQNQSDNVFAKDKDND